MGTGVGEGHTKQPCRGSLYFLLFQHASAALPVRAPFALGNHCSHCY